MGVNTRFLLIKCKKMGILVVLASMGTLAVGMEFGGMFHVKCSEVVDIYASRDSYKYVVSECPHTKTLVCDQCPNYYIKRGDYDEWAEQFYQYNLQPPYPRRTDTAQIIYPK